MQEKLTHLIARRFPLRCEAQTVDDGLSTVLAVRSSSGDELAVLLCNLGTGAKRYSIEIVGATGQRTLSRITLEPGTVRLDEQPCEVVSQLNVQRTVAPGTTQLIVARR